jgi:hypothetical protein
MTLFFAHDADAPPQEDAAGLPAARLLTAAIDAFLAQAAPPR